MSHAIVAAGGLTAADAATIVRLRGRFMQEAVPSGRGAMAALMGLDPEQTFQVDDQVLARTRELVMLGAAGNVARNVSALGGSVALVGLIGGDAGVLDLVGRLHPTQRPRYRASIHLGQAVRAVDRGDVATAAA